jgi:peptidyl-prolyl cis-trans isomerase A (cyclophilin A)
MLLRRPALLALLLLTACRTKPEEPTPSTDSLSAVPEADREGAAAAPAEKSAKPAPMAEAEPTTGPFTLEQATVGLAAGKTLSADIKTSLGTLSCDLYADRAPLTVANFVGLARGKRPFKVRGEWVTRPGYDGTTFHRVVKGFMIQGGDPLGNGTGEPGYVIPDEIWEGSRHDRRGLLCMANRGKNTNGMQFFITDGAAPHLDGGYTIFGSCGPDAVMEKLASVPTRGDRALDPPKIEQVTIRRK